MTSEAEAPTRDDEQHPESNADLTADFDTRVVELTRDCIENVDNAEPETALLYARCCASYEQAVNVDDVPVEEALGRMMSAVFEAADQSEIPREHVVESATVFLLDDDEAAVREVLE